MKVFSFFLLFVVANAKPTNNRSTPSANKAMNEESQATPDNDKDKWFPLESNPILINEYISKLGFDTSIYQFVDVFSTEDWALDMIAQPVMAVLMLYPLTPKQLSSRQTDIIASRNDVEEKVWYIKQRISNACGTIGLLHAIMNIPEQNLHALRRPDDDKNGSWLCKFRKTCPTTLSPSDKAQILEDDQDIAKFHDQATSSQLNQTNRGSIDEKTLAHFVALVGVDNKLYELDGRKDGPILHGTTSPNTLLKDACQVVKKFMERDPDEVRFTILALAPAQK